MKDCRVVVTGEQEGMEDSAVYAIASILRFVSRFRFSKARETEYI